MSETQRIYLDYAAATPLDARVKEAMEPYWSEHYGNAGALHLEGVTAKKALEAARITCARAVNAQPDEIIFTSGGTESNNLAVVGLVRSLLRNGRSAEDIELVTTAIEHSSVLDCFRELKEEGVGITLVPVQKNGIPLVSDIEAALTEKTVLVSIMYANNEIGTVLPLPDIARALRRFRKEHHTAFPLFHTDASQAPAYLPCKVNELGVDMMTIDAQKLYGPKGVGFLYRAREVVLQPVIYGGNQEKGLRPGTPVVPLVVGLARAFEIAEEERVSDAQRLTVLRDYFIERIEKEIPDAKLNGDRSKRMPNNINVSLLGFDAESVVLRFDALGIAISTRSACLFGEEGGSYVVRALGKGVEYATSAVRFTLGRPTTKEDIDRTITVLTEIVEKGAVSTVFSKEAAPIASTL